MGSQERDAGKREGGLGRSKEWDGSGSGVGVGAGVEVEGGEE